MSEQQKTREEFHAERVAAGLEPRLPNADLSLTAEEMFGTTEEAIEAEMDELSK